MKSIRIILPLFIACLFSQNGLAQSDTLHLYYRGLETKVYDSTEIKITNWAKSLKGRKVDIEVLAYYNDSKFKKYSQERSDELFIVINRKARDLINIKFIGPTKGAKSQRSVADIVYTFQGAADTPAPSTKKDTKENKAAGAAAVGVVGGAAASTPDAKPEKATPSDKKTESQNAAKENKTVKAEKSNSKYDVIMDTTYVNGVMKVTKRKVKKQN